MQELRQIERGMGRGRASAARVPPERRPYNRASLLQSRDTQELCGVAQARSDTRDLHAFALRPSEFGAKPAVDQERS